MLRQIITIDKEKCNGCGLCAAACHEGAIEIVEGKACLAREHYCDGLGDCLPACPTGAISFETREAPAYDEAAVLASKAAKAAPACPGMRVTLQQPPAPAAAAGIPGQLCNFPVQLKLVPVMAPFFQDADLLIAADCTAFACGSFHSDFIRGRTTVIGCPKLDSVDYAQKLTQIFALNNIRSVTLTRMEVPCCGGLAGAVERAIEASGKTIPCRVVILSNRGEILSQKEL